jgi:predicted HicB family RNase H-like nuclease
MDKQIAQTEIKNLCVRMPEELIKRVKLAALTEGVTMQDWITGRITDMLDFEDEERKAGINKK